MNTRKISTSQQRCEKLLKQNQTEILGILYWSFSWFLCNKKQWEYARFMWVINITFMHYDCSALHLALNIKNLKGNKIYVWQSAMILNFWETMHASMAWDQQLIARMHGYKKKSVTNSSNEFKFSAKK